MTGQILELHQRGTGALRGEDGKTYSFRRGDLRAGWFHDLTIGASVTFLPNTKGNLAALEIRIQPSARG